MGSLLEVLNHGRTGGKTSVKARILANGEILTWTLVLTDFNSRLGLAIRKYLKHRFGSTHLSFQLAMLKQKDRCNDEV